MMVKIRLSPAALQDIQEIKEYITNVLCNPIAADRTVKRIVNDYTLLETSPYMGPSLSSIVPVETDYRFLVSGNYIIFYKPDNEYVSIIRVLYGRRDYIKVLFGNICAEEE